MSELARQLVESTALAEYFVRVEAELSRLAGHDGDYAGNATGVVFTNYDHDFFVIRARLDEYTDKLVVRFVKGTKFNTISHRTCPINIDNLTWSAELDAKSLLETLQPMIEAAELKEGKTTDGFNDNHWLALANIVLADNMPKSWPA